MDVTLKHGTWPSADRETIAAERLSLVGYVDLGWGVPSRYPLPLFTLDNTVDVKPITTPKTYTRIQGIRPDHREKHTFVTGQWEAQVDIEGEVEFGEGAVYLGNANTPSESTGHIFEQLIPFDPANELAYVREPDNFDVLAKRELTNHPAPDYSPETETYRLVYAPATVLEQLGRFAID